MANVPPPPTVGDIVDDGHLKLTHLLGQGGFSSVFRATETSGPNPRSYAVKCLQPPQSRHVHLREATLHSLCSVHPSVAPLRKIIFHDQYYTLLVMDYYPEGDLFAAILSRTVYLGRPQLIKSVFLQILNAVIACHEQGVFLRDLKPENILVANQGTTVHLTDFGLATTDFQSSEFKTGSVYHMSPECIGPDPYSPQQNDIWSLGILLLNLVTSRNPWRTARTSDPTFSVYVSTLEQASLSGSDSEFMPLLPRILPISDKLNSLLERILCLNPAHRISLRELRREIKRFGDGLEDWYSSDVVFQGSCARCAWEAESDDPSQIDNDDMQDAGESCVPPLNHSNEEEEPSPPSSWSEDSLSPSIVYCLPVQPSSSLRSLGDPEQDSADMPPLELEDIIHITPPPPPKSHKRLQRPHPIPTSKCSTPTSASLSMGSLDGPITPRDAALFTNPMIVDPQTHLDREDITRECNSIQNDIEKVHTHNEGQLGPSFLPHRLFGKAAGLFSRT